MTSRPPVCAIWKSASWPPRSRSLKQQGLTILLVEHDMSFVMGLTDHLVVVDFGTKIAEGTPGARCAPIRSSSRPTSEA